MANPVESAQADTDTHPAHHRGQWREMPGADLTQVDSNAQPVPTPRKGLGVPAIIAASVAFTLLVLGGYRWAWMRGALYVAQHAVAVRTHTLSVPASSANFGPGFIFIDIPQDSSAARKIRALNRLLEEPVLLQEVRDANPELDLDHIQGGTSIRVPTWVLSTQEVAPPLEITVRDVLHLPKITVFGINHPDDLDPEKARLQY